MKMLTSVMKNKNKNSVWVALGLSILAMLLVMLLFYPNFEYNDDQGMMSLCNGMRGFFEPRLRFSNVVLGIILVKLYTVVPAVPWYTALQAAVLLASITAIAWVILNKLSEKSALWMTMLVILPTSYEAYIQMQFTKTAGIASAAALSLLVYAVMQEKIRPEVVVAGMILALLGSLYRFKQFECIVLVMLALGIFFLMWLKTRRKGTRLRRFIAALVIFTAAGGLGIAANSYDLSTFASDELQEYRAYTQQRALFLDYGVPSYDELGPEAIEAGVDELTYDLISSWNYQDSERITTDTWVALQKARGEKELNLTFVKKCARTLVKGLPGITTFKLFCVILLLWMIAARKKKPQIILAVIEAVVLAGMYAMFCYQGRVIVNRIDVGIWLAVIMLILLSGAKTDYDRVGRLGWGVMVICIIAGGYQMKDFLKSSCQADMEAASLKAREITEYVQADKEHLYIAKAGQISYSTAYGPWDSVPVGIAENYYSLGGWTSEMPWCKSSLKKFGVDNPITGMIDRDDVYLMDNKIDLTIEYLEKWHNCKLDYELVDKVGGRKIYSIYTVE